MSDWTGEEGSRMRLEVHLFCLFAKVNCRKAKDIAQERRKTVFFLFSPRKESKQFISTLNAYLCRSWYYRYSTGIFQDVKMFYKKGTQVGTRGTVSRFINEVIGQRVQSLVGQGPTLRAEESLSFVSSVFKPFGRGRNRPALPQKASALCRACQRGKSTAWVS